MTSCCGFPVQAGVLFGGWKETLYGVPKSQVPLFGSRVLLLVQDFQNCFSECQRMGKVSVDCLILVALRECLGLSLLLVNPLKGGLTPCGSGVVVLCQRTDLRLQFSTPCEQTSWDLGNASRWTWRFGFDAFMDPWVRVQSSDEAGAPVEVWTSGEP
jgi:hypothetical protein